MKNTHESIQNTIQNIDFDTDWILKPFSHPERTIRLATAFSGIGAIEHAFQRLGLSTKIVFAGDIDANCKKMYFANYEINEEDWFTDIHDFNAVKYRGKVDLLVGGAPCQAFSTVGFQHGFEDTRGTLFREYARVIKECQPKVFIFENVHGLFTHDNGITWDVIKNTFEDYCDYDIYYQCLNAKDYGIPQRRERLFCVGFKKKTEFKFPRPIELKYKMYDFLEDYTLSKYYIQDSDEKIITPYDEKIGKADINLNFNEFRFKCKEVEDKYYLSEKVASYVLASGTKTFKTPVETDCDIARTLLSSMHKMHRSGVDNYVTYKKEKGVNGLRKLTPRECFRLMGFTDDFNIVVSNTAAYQEAGNSIVVDVLIAILKQMDITQYGEPKEQENDFIRLGTVFSGIGAIEHAFQRLGIKTKIQFAGDIDEYCKKEYFANYDIDPLNWHNDIYQFDATKFKGQVDLLVGGAPCQAFSMRGKRGGFEDTRGTLFREFARVILECEPRVFIFENVKGMLNHDHGNTWKVIKETFERDCGYHLYVKVLNAKDYGVPQSRERLFCVGFKDETKFEFPEPMALNKCVYDFLEKKVDDKYFLPPKGFAFITKTINKTKMYTQINGNVMLCQKRNQQFNWHGDFVFHPYDKVINANDGFQDRVYAVSEAEEQYYANENCSKYSVKESAPGQHELFYHTLSESPKYGWFRKLTPRECLRLMGFEDSFKIVVSDSEVYKQAGNSIVVDCLIAILKQIYYIN